MVSFSHHTERDEEEDEGDEGDEENEKKVGIILTKFNPISPFSPTKGKSEILSPPCCYRHHAKAHLEVMQLWERPALGA